MPFKSKKQANTMRAAAHDPAFAKKVGVPMATAKKLVEHAKGYKKPKSKPKR
jgi:hypothetical protein